MAVTVGLTDQRAPQKVAHNYYMLHGTITFDDSYPAGGESLGALLSTKFFTKLQTIQFFGDLKGYSLDYDYDNDKVKVKANAPAIVIEEKHTAVGKAVTLDYPAAFIINVCTAGQNEALTGTADTLADNECQLSAAIADGVPTGIGTYGATDTIYVTYVTQAWRALYDLLVQEEEIAIATGLVSLAYAPMGLMYVYADTTGLLLPVDIAEAGDVADGEVCIDFTVAAGVGTNALRFNAAQNEEVGYVTYLKKPSSGWIADRLVADENPTASGADPFLNTFDFPCLAWLLTGCAIVDNGVTQKLIEQAATPAAGEINCNWNPGNVQGTGAAPAAGFVIGGKSNVTVTAGAYIKGQPWEIPDLVPLEVKNGTDLSGLTVRFIAFGTKAG